MRVECVLWGRMSAEDKTAAFQTALATFLAAKRGDQILSDTMVNVLLEYYIEDVEFEDINQ